jgi:hypothetical protein
LIREYDVPEELASRLAQYFGESASDAGLIDDSGVVKLPGLGDEIVTAHGETTRGADPRLPPPESSLGLAQSVSVDVFRVRLTGPGMDSSIELQTEDDLVILDAMLAKIRRSLRSE